MLLSSTVMTLHAEEQTQSKALMVSGTWEVAVGKVYLGLFYLLLLSLLQPSL